MILVDLPFSHPPSLQNKKMDVYDFLFEISSPASFKNMCEIIGNVLSEAKFVVEKTGAADSETAPNAAAAHAYLRVDCMDTARACKVQARYTVPLRSRHKSLEFGVNMKKFNGILKQAPSTGLLRVYRLKDEDCLRIQSVNKSDARSFTLATLELNVADAPIVDLTPTVTVQMPLMKFYNVIKSSRQLNCDKITIKVQEEQSTCRRFFSIGLSGDDGVTGEFSFLSSAAGKQQQGDQKIRIDGDSGDVLADHMHDFSSSPLDDVMVIDTADAFSNGGVTGWTQNVPNGTATTVVEEVFQTAYLYQFMKSMDRSQIYLALAPNVPMIMNYQLGLDAESVIQLIIVPLVS